jgi:hypothetical protein
MLPFTIAAPSLTSFQFNLGFCSKDNETLVVADQERRTDEFKVNQKHVWWYES